MTKASDAIAEGYQAFERAYFSGDADAISMMYTDDAKLLLPQVPVVNGGKYIVIWQRQANGGWKIHRDIFN